MLRWIPYMAIAVLIIGCSTLQVSQDYDTGMSFSRLHTFAWQNDVQPKNDDIRLNNSLLDSRIRSAVEEALVSAGFTKSTKQEADFLVAYALAVQQKIESGPSSGVGFGIGWGGPHGSVLLSSGSDVRSYDQGLLLIDVLDSGSGRLLWQGKATDRMIEHSNPAQNVEKINETVKKVLAQFPPTGK